MPVKILAFASVFFLQSIIRLESMLLNACVNSCMDGP